MNTPSISVQELELRSNNPYSIGTIFIFPEGDALLERKPIEVTKSPRDQYYTIKKGDTLNELAFRYFGNSKEWWILADVNNIEFPFELPMGLTIIIPDYTKLKTYNS
jgi:nucleoid-associated protein YgaU